MELPRVKIATTPDYLPIYWANRHTHLLVMGKSGTGKTSLLSHIWQTDRFYRNAQILVEPTGFLAREAYSLSRGKAMYCSLETPVSLNPLQVPYDPNTISDLVAECINQVVARTTPNQSFTVKMRAILDRAIKYCLEHNRKSLINVRDWIINLQEKRTSETKDGVISRLDFLLNDERLRPIICGNNSVKWGEFIRKKQTFILDCFGMSKEKMIFVGTLIAQGIKNYFRYERPKVYKPVSFYIDECHNFINLNFLDILKEGRKFKLSCILATQDFATIDEHIQRVMLNTGSIVAFRCGAREAGIIARELYCSPPDLQFIEKYHLAFLTEKERGIGKAPRPPFAKPMEPKKPEPKRKSRGWFPLKPYEAT